MEKLFAELRRRNVFRVAGVYAVAGWLIAQAAGVLENALNMPGWFDTVIVSALLLGFPVAMILAWAFEMTPEGVKLTANVPEGESIAPKTGRKLDYAILAGLALAVVVVVADRVAPRKAAPVAAAADAAIPATTAPAVSAASIAVLPFADMSPAGDQGYFSDGIAEEILNVLARMPELKVAGRTSSFSFRGENEDLKAIGAALGVANILEGSVRKQGDRIRITAQLIKADDGFHLWSDTYDRNLDDIFAVQDEISAAIAEALATKISGRPASAPSGPVDPQAYDLYLRARQTLAARGQEKIAQAAALFDAATVLAPDFDAAWSGAARAYSLLPNYNGGVDSDFYVGRSRRAAEKALALNARNGEAHSVIAMNTAAKEFDLIKAIEETKLAVEYGPNDAEIANFAGDIYRQAADFENAFKWERRALELDPLHPINHIDLGFVYFAMRQCKEAVAAHQEGLKLDPALGQGYNALALALLCAGDIAGAKAAVEKYAQVEPGAASLVDAQIAVATAEGRRADARRLTADLKRRAGAGAELHYLVAQHESRLGDYAAAASSIRRAVETRDWNFAGDIYWFLPEDWPDDPAIRAALDAPALTALWETRRQNLTRYPRASSP